jgi:hypothetical protein
MLCELFSTQLVSLRMTYFELKINNLVNYNGMLDQR